MIRLRHNLFAVLALGAIAGAAHADNLQYVGLEYNNTLTGDVSFVDPNTNQQVTEDVYIGKLLFNNGTTTFDTVCADLDHILDGNSHVYSPSFTDPNDGSPLGMAGRLVAANFASSTTAESAAALQIAVWAALYNPGNTFSANTTNFSVTGVDQSVLDLASSMYAAAAPTTVGSAEYFQSDANGAQSQLRPMAAPEPATFGALGIGAIGLLRRRRSVK